MIRVVNLSKSFDGKEVLSNISAEFEPGKCSFVIGSSGSGKTVLLKSLVGLIQPTSGQVWYNDTENMQDSVRSRVGMLFQGSALFDFATSEENVMFPMDIFTNMSKEEKRERANFCLSRVGLTNVNKLYPSELSGGMQKRVAIARALALNPDYLFCDEPNSGLDPVTSIKIDNLIKELTVEYNITTIVNSHDMNSVLEIADKVIFIHKGVKLWEGTNREILFADCKELNDFVFASSMAKELKLNMESKSNL